MNLAQAKQRIRAPGATLVLPLWAFADEWESRPEAPVCVGLRLLSENDKLSARSQAEQQAWKLQPEGGDDWVDAFNDCLQMQIDAVAMCDPNDVTNPPEIFPIAVDQVPHAFTSKGAAYVFQAVARHEIAVSSLGELAERQDVERLVALLGKVDPNSLGPGLRRHITYLLEQLEPHVDESVDARAINHTGNEVAPVVG